MQDRPLGPAHVDEDVSRLRQTVVWTYRKRPRHAPISSRLVYQQDWPIGSLVHSDVLLSQLTEKVFAQQLEGLVRR
jgi:hypothetical protein